MADSALRVALLVKALPLHHPGGQEHHTWTLARGLARAGHRVTAVTTAHPGGMESLSVDGVAIQFLRSTSPGRNSWGFFTQMARWVRLFDGEFDVFHSQGFAAMRARPVRTPLVTTVHGTVWSETPLARQVWPLLTRREKLAALWRFKGRTVLGPLAHAQWHRAARLLCDSEFTRGELLQLESAWADRIDVVPLGQDLPVPVERDPPGTVIALLSVGRLERVRGLADLLEALARLRERGRFHLTVVGDGPDRRRIECLIGSQGLGGQVTLTGRVDDETLAGLWRRADLFVNPEWSQPAFGLVSLEALAWGVPVLGTRTGATPEIVTPATGWLVPPRQPDALAEVLAEISGDPARLRAKASACRARAAEFPVERMVQGTVDAYLRAMGRWPF